MIEIAAKFIDVFDCVKKTKVLLWSDGQKQ